MKSTLRLYQDFTNVLSGYYISINVGHTRVPPNIHTKLVLWNSSLWLYLRVLSTIHHFERIPKDPLQKETKLSRSLWIKKLGIGDRILVGYFMINKGIGKEFALQFAA
jgi:hypothetical protein